MVLLRRVIGDALRARRQGQHRTLREVSTAANVSLGYLSEIERGQKEASSELLGSICDALGAQLSDVLREVSDTLALAEQVDGVLVPAGARGSGSPDADGRTPPAEPVPAARTPGPGPSRSSDAAPTPEPVPAEPVARAARSVRVDGPVRRVATDGTVSVSVHQDSPLKATLRTTRTTAAKRERDVVFAA